MIAFLHRCLAALAACLATAAAVELPGSIKAELRVAATGIAGDQHTLWLRAGPERDPLEVPLNVRTFSAPISYAHPAQAI